MHGNKAVRLAQLCRSRGWQYTRFDYRGHGESTGDFAGSTIAHWLQDAQCILDHVCSDNQILVGSSMGAWIAVLLALQRPTRISGLLGIAAAPDFTTELIWDALDQQTQSVLARGETWMMTNAYDQTLPIPITPQLIDSGREHSVLQRDLAVDCPVRLLHGTADTDVPHQLSQRLLQQLQSTDAQLTLVKYADHRFSTEPLLQLIERQLEELRTVADTCGPPASE